ncbi:histidine kinase 3 [Actinidia rufa]|uniref:histidine kinase n=1 Tax=Actinidia rufa TaxID=165716 RepID=A0A7J0E0G2_9ERIC|nr:histidine kinase 3 [Actinidia rufa]
MSSQAMEKRKETLASMCDERARMLQDQFNVIMNHVQNMSILISTFHHEKNPSSIDQSSFARYTERTAFERPLTSGVAYAVRVLHSEREQFEKQQGWTIKRMDTLEQTPVHKDEYSPEALEPSPIQKEYAPIIFAQDTISHVVSIDVLSCKEDRENVLRARASGKGVVSAPFPLLKSNRFGVVLTFAVCKTVLPSSATPEERIQATDGYLGGVFDIESLVDKLLQQLASKQTILVNVYDVTESLHPISMYGSNVSSDGLQHVSALNFGDPLRKHEMHCRFKHKPPWPWLVIMTSIGILVMSFLLGHIFHATVNRIAKVEDDFREMMELKKQAEAADVAKSQFLATVSHEIRTPMNGVLGMLHMLMDTDLDVTQQDYVRTAQGSGKALISLINELAVYISDRVPEMLIGDPGRFRQIITNLMGNSIKFTEKGHIFVTVHLVEEVMESTEIKTESSSENTLSGFPVADRRQSQEGFRIFSQDGPACPLSSLSSDLVNIIVSVEDTGVGIPLEAQSRVFTPFMQVGPSISRMHGGTGIGLSISKCLVGLMNGEISFSSLPRIGSTFTFTAVLSNVNSNTGEHINQQINHQSNSASSEFRGMTALLVDPRPVRAKVSRYHIQRLGIHVEVVPNLNQGFSRIDSGNIVINMVLIEQEIWDKDSGLSLFVDKLRNLDRGLPPKLFLLTNSISSTRSSFATSGVYTPTIIMKPLRASMLAASLQRAMGVGNRCCCFLKEIWCRCGLCRQREEGNITVKAPHKFDACFMDIQMPEMDGFEATKRIREMELNINNCVQHGELLAEPYENVSDWHVPIVAMTADVIQATHEECLRCGMDGYVSKPFEIEQLYQEVSRFFQTASSQNS